MNTTDTWSFTKLTRAFGRYFDDERAQLSPKAVTAGEIVRGFLYTLGEAAAFKHAGTRSDALRAIDEFAEARKP